MKNLLASISFLFILGNVFAQSPDRMSFQAVIRDATGKLVSNSSVGLKMSVRQGSASVTVVCAETHTVMTNGNGLITLVIGDGMMTSGVFSEIDWAEGPY